MPSVPALDPFDPELDNGNASKEESPKLGPKVPSLDESTNLLVRCTELAGQSAREESSPQSLNLPDLVLDGFSQFHLQKRPCFLLQEHLGEPKLRLALHL